MKKSESIKNLAASLVKAQNEMPVVKMNAVNPFLKNKYADLGAIISATRPVLASNGLSISQTMTCDDERIGVTTLLMHSSGEWLEDTATLPLGDERGKSLAQVAGSIVTYLRRYGWSSILGIYADEDGDGNAPARKNGNGHKPAKQEKPSNHMPEKHAMSYETASQVKDSKGVLYTDKTNEELSDMTIGISKALNKKDLTQEQRETYQMKMDAISTILTVRNRSK
jgi:hypothetical protein